MPLKIWSLLAGTSIALQSISVLFSTLLLPEVLALGAHSPVLGERGQEGN